MKTLYRQMLIDQKTHDQIDLAKAALYKLSGRKVSSRDVVDEFVGRRARLLSLRKEIKDYVNAFVAKASANPDVLGLLLFGSVARNSYSRLSDIDIFVVTKGRALGYFEAINDVVNSTEGQRQPLLDAGFSSRISFLLVSKADLNVFRPIYINLFEDGIILFERNDTLTDFLCDIRGSVDYKKEVLGSNVVIRWKIRERQKTR